MNDYCIKGKEISAYSDYRKMKTGFDNWSSEVKAALQQAGLSEKEQGDMAVLLHFKENEFAPAENMDNLRKTILKAVAALPAFALKQSTEFTDDMALQIIRKLMSNFCLYYRSMYQDEVHKSATIKEGVLNQFIIGNEYDVQRILYSLLRPLFPAVRLEVNSDNGYSGTRFDIFLDQYDVVIEVKCSRAGMKEKVLTEQLGSDGFHYSAKIIFMFIYDKENVIKNPDAYRRAFHRTLHQDGKMVEMFIVQPVKL